MLRNHLLARFSAYNDRSSVMRAAYKERRRPGAVERTRLVWGERDANSGNRKRSRPIVAGLADHQHQLARAATLNKVTLSTPVPNR
jgi:hypothetical protein